MSRHLHNAQYVPKRPLPWSECAFSVSFEVVAFISAYETLWNVWNLCCKDKHHKHHKEHILNRCLALRINNRYITQAALSSFFSGLNQQNSDLYSVLCVLWCKLRVIYWNEMWNWWMLLIWVLKPGLQYPPHPNPHSLRAATVHGPDIWVQSK